MHRRVKIEFPPDDLGVGEPGLQRLSKWKQRRTVSEREARSHYSARTVLAFPHCLVF